MKNILLENELKQIRLLMNYDPKETLTENEIPKLENEGTYYYGELDMTNASSYGSFKNNGMFPDGPKIIYIKGGGKAFSSNDLKIRKSKIEVKEIPGDIPEPKETKPVPYDFKLQVEEPFEYDKDELTSEGLDKIDVFAKLIFNAAEDSGSPEGAQAYYSFLKNITIPVYAFSSIDALSNYKDGGTLPACSQYGKGKGPRYEYNKCLSQKRADKIVEYLKGKGGILAELNYTPKGMGETNRFSKIVWEESKKPNPKNDKKNPNGINATRPDRRFIVKFPKFDYIPGKSNIDDDGEPGYTEIETSKNMITYCFNWLKELRFFSPEKLRMGELGVVGGVISGRDGMAETIINGQGQTTPAKVTAKDDLEPFMAEKGICWDPNLKGCGGTTGNFKYCDNQFPDNWMIGQDLGLGGNIKVPVRVEKGGGLLYVDKNKIKDVLGPEYDNYFYDKDIDFNPSVSLNQNGITVQTTEQTLTFGPWGSPKDGGMGQFKETPFKFLLVERDFEVGPEGAKYKPSSIEFFKFSLSKNP